MPSNRTQLYDLISKMTSSERRYFKIFSERHVLRGENGYVILFDILADMSNKKIVYSEDILIKRLRFCININGQYLQALDKKNKVIYLVVGLAGFSILLIFALRGFLIKKKA